MFNPDEFRDRVAIAALSGLIHRGFSESGNSQSAFYHATLAYSFADAMLAARCRPEAQEPEELISTEPTCSHGKSLSQDCFACDEETINDCPF